MVRLSDSSQGSGSSQAVRKLDARKQQIALQRKRMIAATVAAFEEGGVTRLTVTDVIHRARVSRKTFYDVFKDAEDCFLDTFEDALHRAGQVARAAYAGEHSWRAGMRAAVTALLEMVEREPGLARMCVVDAPAAGERVLERHTEVVQELAVSIERGRQVSRTSKASRG